MTDLEAIRERLEKATNPEYIPRSHDICTLLAHVDEINAARDRLIEENRKLEAENERLREQIESDEEAERRILENGEAIFGAILHATAALRKDGEG